MKIIVLGSRARSLTHFRGVMLRTMVKKGHSCVACAPNADKTIIATLAESGVDYHHIHLSRTGLNPFSDVVTIKAMYSLFKKEKPDIVLFYTIKPVLYGSLAAVLAGVPSIYSMITGLGYAFTENGLKQRLIGQVLKLFYRIILPFNSKVFFQNRDDRDDFIRDCLLKNPDKAVIINGSGVDIDHYRPTPFPSAIVFLLIGRLLKDKGVLEYIQAARIVKEKYPATVFRLVGRFDTNPVAISKQQVAAWVEEGAIEYLGWLDDIRPTMAASSVYVLPSFREGTPRTVLEAMAMGRPIITSDAPGCRETVIAGVNGFLVPVKNAQALAEAMLKFIDDPDLIQEMGRKSRKIAEEKYDVHKVNATILETMGL